MHVRSSLGLLLLSLVVVGAAACQKTTTNTTTVNHQGSVTIRTLGPNAFGSLTNISTTQTTSLKAGTSEGGQATNPAPAQDVQVKPISTDPMTWVFTGTPVSLAESKLNVYERQTGTALSMPEALKTVAGLGMMTISSLTNPSIENLTMRSGDELWTISLPDGMISMYLQSSPLTTMKAVSAPIPPRDMSQPATTELSTTPTNSTNTTQPKDDHDTVVRIATAFLAKQGIDTSGYGQPIISNLEGYPIPVTSIRQDISVPPVPAVQPTAQIIYPYLLDGQTIVQTTGDPAGLTLTVDAVGANVIGLYGLSTKTYSQSAYDAQTDFSQVQKLAEQGGVNGYYGGSPLTGMSTRVNLGTPERVFMTSYMYTDNRSRELYVPALRFPVTPETVGYPKWVVVPLVKDLPASLPVGVMESTPAPGSDSSGTPSQQ